VSVEIFTTTGGYLRRDNMFGGAVVSSQNYTPDSGVSTEQWTKDVEFWGGTTGDICDSSSNYGAEVAGSNGKPHYQINRWGTTNGHYPKDHVTGFKFQVDQSSDAGHALFVRRVGVLLLATGNTNTHFVDVGGLLPKYRAGTYTYTYDFSSDVMEKLANAYVFGEFRLLFSTDGGSGSRDSSVKIFNFQFNYYTSGQNMIIPAYRPYSERDQNNRIA
jgi:hypothetical protein